MVEFNHKPRTYGFVKSEKRLEAYSLKEWNHIVFSNERWSNDSSFMEEAFFKSTIGIKSLVMSSASSAVTYTSVYTDSEPGRVFWGADEEISDGGSPRVIVYGYDGLPMQPVDPPSPDYVPAP
ncbi:hypothetical protein Tco_1273907 [Tanacetum coccineum]